MFEELTFEDVMERMLDRIDDTYDKRESSPIYAALAPAALEIMNLYAAFDDMLDEVYGDTASREYLIRIAATRGMEPYPATNAVVCAEFTPAGIEIEEGTGFTSPEADYTVIEKLSDGIYKLECQEAGNIGNLYIGDIIPNEYIDGLETAKIVSVLIYGEQEEDTESFRERYMDSFEAHTFGGNRNDYQNKTLAIGGVGAVKVIPVWNGPGTVKLVIADENCKKASEELIEKVQTAFDPELNGKGDGLAPIGHIVTVNTVEEVAVNVLADITYDTGYDWNTCKVAVEAAIEEYIDSIRKNWNSQDHLIVRISSINTSILSVQGVLDVSGTKLNDAGNNLELGECQVPVFGGVEVAG